MDLYAELTSVLMILTIVLVTIPTSSSTPDATNISPTPPKHSPFIDLVEKAGYIAEEYEVVTEDDYMLYMHRIPGGPKSPVAPGKSPVLLIHGFLGSSDSWVLQGAEYDFAYLLVDSGYDVWLMNARGTYYGRRHKRISTDAQAFWQFSWHEIGVYDIAASIDRVLSITVRPKVSIVAYSLGSSAMYALLSIRPEYNGKVHVSAVFGSIAIFTHDVPGILISVGLYLGDELESVLGFMGKYDVMSRRDPGFSIVDLCRYPLIDMVCRKISFHLFGITHADGHGKLIMPEAMGHHPQGTSVQTLMHLRQIVLTRNFSRFDYGPTRNSLQYGNFTPPLPPEYPLEKITAPMVLYYGPGDRYTTKQDVDVLLEKIPHAVSTAIANANFGHRDFITSRTAKSLLYDNVLQVLAHHSRTKLDE